MSWLTKLSNVSSHRGQYLGKYIDEQIWDGAQSSADELADIEQEELDYVLVLSRSEQEEKGKKVIDDDSQSGEDKHLAEAKSKEDEHLAEVKSKEDELFAKAQLEEDEQLAIALQESVYRDPYDNDSQSGEDKHLAEAKSKEDEHLAEVKSKEDELFAKAQLEEDEQLAIALQESVYMDPYNNGNIFQSYPLFSPPGYRICAGCNTEIHGETLSRMHAVWHPKCFRCHTCNLPINDHELSMSGKRPYHKSCYEEQHRPICDVCKNFIPTNSAGSFGYMEHPFWKQKYCPSHERDGTPRCCSCERMETTRYSKYLLHDDGRKLCLECLDSAVLDTHECQPLYLEIQDFYEGLQMKLEQQIPMFLVERQALNEAMEGEKNGHHHMAETRGLCMSEEQTITKISRKPRIGVGMITEPYRLSRRCEVTAVLVLYGLPRLLTGSILAHEMMHAWLRLKGYRNLRPEVEEGICQVLAHMWLDSEIYLASGSGVASSSSSSAPSPSSSSSKKGKRSDFEKKLGEFFKHKIETDTSAAYGDGFRMGNPAVLKYGPKRTLDHIRMTGSFP